MTQDGLDFFNDDMSFVVYTLGLSVNMSSSYDESIVSGSSVEASFTRERVFPHQAVKIDAML